MNKQGYSSVEEDDTLLQQIQKSSQITQNYTRKNQKLLLYAIFTLFILIIAIYSIDSFKQAPNYSKLIQMMQYIPKKVPFDIKNQYFYFRLHLWDHQKQIMGAQFYHSQLKYPQTLSLFHHQIVILIDARDYTESNALNFVDSVFVQNYNSFKIVFLTNHQSSIVLKLQKQKEKSIIYKYSEQQALQQCQKYDLIFTSTIPGKLIGHLVFNKLDVAFKKQKDRKIIINPILGFSQKQRIPKKRGSQSLYSANNLFAQIIFGQYSYAIKTSQIKQILATSNKCNLNLPKKIILSVFSQLSNNELNTDYIQYNVYSEERRSKQVIQSLITCAQNQNIKDQTVILKIDEYHSLHRSKMIQIEEHKVKQITEQLQNIPDKYFMWYHKVGPHRVDQPLNRTYFAYRHFLDQDNPQILQAQYTYLDKLYSIGNYDEQLPICLVSCGRNLIMDDYYRKYVQFIARQNYTNFKAFYVDDASQDDSAKSIEEYIFLQYPQMRRKINIVSNKVRQQTIGSRLIGFNHCETGDIVIDADADDQLIGAQALQFYNTIYQQNSNIWLFYTKAIKLDGYRNIIRSISAKIPKIYYKKHSLSYHSFVISHLRSFKFQVLKKIIDDDLIDRRTGKYYQRLGDLIIYNFIAQLAGPQRVLFIDQPVYYYKTRTSFAGIKQKKQTGLIARTLDPYKQLDSLESETVKTQVLIQQSQKQKMIQETLIRFNRIKQQQQKPYEVMKNNKKYQQKLQKYESSQIIDQKYNAPTQDIKYRMSLADLFYDNYQQSSVELQKYYYDTRKFILKYHRKQIPILIYSQVPNLQNFENFINSILLQDYTNFKIIFVCSSYEQGAIIKQLLSRTSPVLLQKSYFLQNSTYSFDWCLHQLINQQTILLKIPSTKTMIGTQGLHLINAQIQQLQNKSILIFPQIIQNKKNKQSLSETSGQQYNNQSLKQYFQKQIQQTIAVRILPKKQLPRFSSELINLESDMIVKADYAGIVQLYETFAEQAMNQQIQKSSQIKKM